MMMMMMMLTWWQLTSSTLTARSPLIVVRVRRCSAPLTRSVTTRSPGHWRISSAASTTACDAVSATTARTRSCLRPSRSAHTNKFYTSHSAYDHVLDDSCTLITFRVSPRPRQMYCGHARMCVCLSAAACLHYCTDPDVTWQSGRDAP